MRADEEAEHVMPRGGAWLASRAGLFVTATDLAHLEPAHDLDPRHSAQSLAHDLAEGAQRVVVDHPNRAVAKHHLGGAVVAAILAIIEGGDVRSDGHAAKVA